MDFMEIMASGAGGAALGSLFGGGDGGGSNQAAAGMSAFNKRLGSFFGRGKAQNQAYARRRARLGKGLYDTSIKTDTAPDFEQASLDWTSRKLHEEMQRLGVNPSGDRSMHSVTGGRGYSQQQDQKFGSMRGIQEATEGSFRPALRSENRDVRSKQNVGPREERSTLAGSYRSHSRTGSLGFGRSSTRSSYEARKKRTTQDLAATNVALKREAYTKGRLRRRRPT